MTDDPGDGTRVAIVGAGISGLTCARTLTGVGAPVILFEKARGPGGRMSTRRVDGRAFDHGAQYFTVRDERFRAEVEKWVEAGRVAEWPGRVVAIPAGEAVTSGGEARRYVGVPGMSAVTRHLSSGLELKTAWRAVEVERRRAGWRVTAENGETSGPHAVLVFAVPAPQALPFLTAAPRLAERVRGVRLAACWAVMLGFPSRVPVEFDGAFVNEGPLSWIARNNSKPGRSAAESWVLHGSPDWSEAHLEDSAEEVIAALVGAFRELCPAAPPEPSLRRAHRWRYALPRDPLERHFLFDEEAGIGVCGDWCGGPRVEGAYLSGRSLGEHIGRIVRAHFG